MRLDKSQSEFALMIGASLSTLQNWEQGRRRPEGPARALLKVAAENPDAIAAALDQQGSRMTTSANDPGGKGQI
jgi:putative transcriptional regulator